MRGYLRTATEEDMDLLFAWANETDVRKNSFSEKNITYEEHRQWYKKLLNSKDSRQYIYMCDGVEIGQVRIKIVGNEAEIGYSICFQKRCMGYGKEMIYLLREQIRHDFPEVRKLTAKVKPDNVASQKVFLDMGYVEKYQCYELEMDKAEDKPELSENRGGIGIFLTNNKNTLKLYDWINDRFPMIIYSGRLDVEQIYAINPQLIVSYNYKYIIDREVIHFMQGNMINLHISYLPWNRGASPNIWSFIDNTPKGVTIHQISPECDAGKLLYQKECFFCAEEETFESVYHKLNNEIIALFMTHWEEIRDGNYILYDQKGEGSSHTINDLKKLRACVEFQWSDNIAVFLEKYKIWKTSAGAEG